MTRPPDAAPPPKVVVIAGGTASGKSEIARALARDHGALHIGHDRYYFDVADPRHHDYDHPSALDSARLAADLAELTAGRPAELPVYHFPTHTRLPEVERVQPRPLVVVEGILVLAEPAIAALADLAVFVHADDDVRLARRILRDSVERRRDVADVIRQWMATVRPGHQRFVEPCRERAHLVVDGQGPIGQSVARILAMLGT